MVLSAADRLGAIDRSMITLKPARCLHALDKYSNCQACYNICPVDAIQSGKPPTLETEACETCYACLPVCPTGAYSSDDAVPALLQSAARASENQVELICAHHPNPDRGQVEALGIQVRGCLAGLGVSAYLSLAALGLETITIAIDTCTECPWGALQENIQDQVGAAGRLLAARGWGGELIANTGDVENQTERLYWQADNPPLSRRDLFRLASRQGQIAAARAMMLDEGVGDKRPSRERARILNALDHLAPAEGDHGSISLAGMGYGMVDVSEACTACAACDRACPTGALTLESGDATFTLSFNPRLCVNCEICIHICAVDAVRVSPEPDFAAVFATIEPIVLLEGALDRCFHCNISFAARPGVKLCPLCEARAENPFGSKIPPGLARIRPQFLADETDQTTDQAKDPVD